MMGRFGCSLCVWTVTLAAWPAVVAGAAQENPPPDEATPANLATDLRAVEEGVEDVNPLAVGRADLSADLGIPLGFGRVYELPPGPDGQRRFARRSGGVWAVFTRADYVSTRDGDQAVAPPNTVLFLGMPPGLDGDTAPAHRPQRVSTRQDLRAGVDPATSPGDNPADPERAEESVPEATVLTDESYRVQRVRSLLNAAAEAGPSS